MKARRPVRTKDGWLTMLPYSGAKAALNMLTQGFSAAFSPNVRVNTIVIGPFATDVAEHWADPPDHDQPGWTKAGLRVEGYTPPPEVIDAIERIIQAAGIDVGGIEYLVDENESFTHSSTA